MLKPNQISMITMVAALISAFILTVPILGINLPTREAAVAPLQCAMVKEGTWYDGPSGGPFPVDREPVPNVMPTSPIGNWIQARVTGIIQPDFLLGMGTPCDHMMLGERQLVHTGFPNYFRGEPYILGPGEAFLTITHGLYKGQVLYPYAHSNWWGQNVFPGPPYDATHTFYIVYDNGETEHVFGVTEPMVEYRLLCLNGIDDDGNGLTDLDDPFCQAAEEIW